MSANMKNRNLVLIAGVLAIGLVAATIIGGQAMSAVAQEGQDDEPMPVDIGCPTGAETCEEATVSTSGSASTSVEPDKVSVTIGVETNGQTAAEAADANADLMEQVLAALEALGITEEQIATSNYNVFPVYNTTEGAEVCIMIYPPPPECLPKTEIVGYTASNSVTVTVDSDFDAGSIIDTAVEAGATHVQGAYFFISEERQNEVRDSLIADAIANARSRADAAASAVGMNVTGIKSIALNDVYFPVFFRDVAAEAADGTVLLPGEQQVSMTVQAVYKMQ
jgi:uncharacterized protein YggE